jgi:hypothetical protein
VKSDSDKDGAPVENVVSLRLATGPLAGPVLCRVVSMVLARADCPMDRLSDAQLVCDAIAAHAPAHVNDGRLVFTVATGASGIELRVEALAERGARGLLADATVPGVGNVLEQMSDELRVIPGEQGSGCGEKLVLTLNRG